MAKNTFRCCWLLGAIAGLLCGATIITGPVAGYVAYEGPELRAILGVPGAYRFSDPLPLPDGTTRVHVAPGQDFALVERGDTGLGILFLNGGTVDHVAAVDNAMSTPDWVVFSVEGRSAVLFSSHNNRLQVIAGLPDAARIIMDLDASALPEVPLSGAVGDNGQSVLVASGRSVYRIAPYGARLIFSAGDIASVIIMRNGAHAAVSDRGTGSVVLLENIRSAPAARTLVTALGGIGKLCPSSDGKTLLVASSGANIVASIDVSSGEMWSYDSGVLPITLSEMRNRDAFVISASTYEPASVFYKEQNSWRFVFIPAATAGAGQSATPVSKP